MIIKFCCVNCFSEPEITNFIKESENFGQCDYCSSKGVNVHDVNEVGEFVWDGFKRYYEDAAESVGYCSAEGGYLLPTDTIDDLLIEDLMVFGDALDNPRELVEDLVTIDGTPYVRKDPYGPPSGKPEEIDYWESFCTLVKNNQRYTALLILEEQKPYLEKHPLEFLEDFLRNICDFLIKDFYPGQIIYRARIYKKEMKLCHKELTCPEPNLTKNQRMCPKGISLFYGGVDAETCISEVRPSVGQEVAVSEFEVLKPFTVLDLSVDFEETVSIFSDQYDFYYEEFLKPFLKHFINDISKPIRRTDNDIEYIPTQVFTEYLKIKSFEPWYSVGTLKSGKDSNSTKIKFDGLLFKSALKKDGINIVLFRGPEISIESKDEDSDQALLLYKGYKIYTVNELKVFYE